MTRGFPARQLGPKSRYPDFILILLIPLLIGMEYKFLEHTADVMFESYGKSYEEALENAAKAMFSILGNAKEKEHFQTTMIQVPESFSPVSPILQKISATSSTARFQWKVESSALTSTGEKNHCLRRI